MTGFVRKLSPILAGIAVASGLYAVLWQQVGATYVAICTDPASYALFLFLGYLLPELIAIAVAAGLVTGAIRGVGRFQNPAVRGAVAAACFGIIVMAAYTFCGPRAVHASDLIPARSSPILIIAYALLTVVSIGGSGITGSAPYAAIAAASASFGDFLREKHKGFLIPCICLACCTALGLAFAHGASVRSALERLAQAARSAERLVRRDLVDLPADHRWLPPHGFLETKLIAADCAIPDGTVSVQFGTGGRMESASVRLVAPKGTSLETKEAALAFLRRHGVRSKAIATLRQSSHGQWISDNGHYSVLVYKWFAPRD